VVVSLTTNRTDRLVAGAEFDSALGVLRIARVQPHQHRHLVAFEGFDHDRAEAARGVVLLAEAIDDPDALWIHDLIGARVTAVDGRPRGTVESVEANPASDLLVLDDGTLVPLRFIVDRSEGELVVDAPPGLFED
jgi:16S rRNA processing protein RimM